MSNKLNIKVDLEKMTLEYDNLFQLDSTLSGRYKGVLHTIFGLDTASAVAKNGTGLDIRGFSPELQPVLGDYLTTREITPYMIIVSPEQVQAPLINPLFSFDEQFIRNVYQKAQHIVGAVTPNEVLWGEIYNRIDLLTSIKDLFMIDSISLRLDTPLETLKNAKSLQEMHTNLRTNLKDNDKINAMISMHKKLNMLHYDDIRGIDMNGTFSITMPVSSFHTRLFDGAYLIREHGQILLIHHQTGKPKLSFGEHVIALNAADPGLPNFLNKNGFIQYSVRREDIEKARREVEDAVLLSNNYDLFPDDSCIDEESNKYALNRKRGLLLYADSLPRCWYELKDLETKVAKKDNDIMNFVERLSPKVKVKLARVFKNEDLLKHLIMHLDELNVDFVAKAKMDMDGIIRDFPGYNAATKKYACYKLSTSE